MSVDEPEVHVRYGRRMTEQAGPDSARSGPRDYPAAELRDGMAVLWDVPVPMDDGVVLRADVFLPEAPGAYPSLLSYGPYAKGLPFQVGYPTAWETLVRDHPDVAAGSTNRYQNWEVVDPEKWTPHGYAIIRVDSRGCGRSPGVVDPFSRRETDDLVQCIDWASRQNWCDGAVGLSGVSYFAMNQWLVAAERPPALKAVCIWEGATDFYRDASHHGGILSTFWQHWYDKQVKSVQYGLGERGPRNPVTGLLVCGDETLSDEELQANRVPFGERIRDHPFIDEFHRERTADWSRIDVPLLSAGNWGGQGLHLRGNIEGYLAASSSAKWLEVHGYEHWTSYYTDESRGLQLAFFNHMLKGADNGWEQRPPVTLQVRHVDGTFTERTEPTWPLPGIDWTRLYLSPGDPGVLAEGVPGSRAQADYRPGGAGLTFLGPRVEEAVEITGPMAAHLWVSTTAADGDLFITVRVFDPSGTEVSFVGAVDPHAPASTGWLRLSHRDIDTVRSRPYRPVHSHLSTAEVEPGTVYGVEVEIWPTSVVLPRGYRLGLTVSGRDYENDALPPITMSNFKNQMRGSGPFLHDDPHDRPPDIFARGAMTLYCGDATPSSLLVPLVRR